MAGSKLTAKIKSSTILEVIIAMVIMVLVFSLSAKKLRAQAVLKDILLNSTADGNKSVTAEGFRIEQEIKIYANSPNLWEVHLTSYDDNQLKIAELKEIILKNP